MDLICLGGLVSFEIWNFLQGLWGSTVLGVCTDFIRNLWNDVAHKLLAIFVGMCKGVCRANVLVQVCKWTATHFVYQDHLQRFIAWLDYQKVVSVGSGPRSSDLDLSSQCDGHTCHRMAFSWQSCWRLSWGFHVVSHHRSVQIWAAWKPWRFQSHSPGMRGSCCPKRRWRIFKSISSQGAGTSQGCVSWWLNCQSCFHYILSLNRHSIARFE